MKRKLAILPLLFISIGACAQVKVSVLQNDGGTPWERSTAEISKIAFENGGVAFYGKDNKEMQAFGFDKIGRLAFLQADETFVSIGKVTGNGSEGIAFVAGSDAISVSGLKPGERHGMALYSADGKTVMANPAWDGSPIATSSLAKGIYILKVNNATFKFQK